MTPPMFELVSCTGQPRTGFSLLPHHGPHLLLLFGHHGKGVNELWIQEEDEPLNAEKKLQAQRGIPQEEGAKSFNCGFAS